MPGTRVAVGRSNDPTLAAEASPEEIAAGKRVFRRLFADPPPEKLGRYEVRRRIGHGAMGIVYAGYDAALNRHVALKVIDDSRAESVEARQRMLREAQAMARLSHPNVVQVYEAAEEDGQVFLAMELVEGGTLRAWIEGDEVLPWRDVVRCFSAIGRGLAAAHSAGVVHRDFKPDNVLLTPGHVPKVADFGLAGLGHVERINLTTTAPNHDVDPNLTSTGAVLGTPRYMSPEQHLGGPTDGRSDQFSFCVVLWEALFKELPFEGDTLTSLVASVTTGTRRRAPKRRDLPSWVRRVCERGLEVDPDDRWPSMDALLDALEHEQARVRWRRAGTAVLAVGVAAAGVYGVDAWDTARRISACADEGAATARHWDDSRRQRVRDGLIGSGASFARATADRVIPQLDAQATALRDVAERACLSATVDRTWKPDVYARARWCLDQRVMELDAFAEQLEGADMEATRLATTTASGMALVDECIDPRRLARVPSIPEAASVDAVHDVRERIARASAMSSSGKYSAALVAAREARRHAEDVGWPPLHAEALHLEAGVLMRLGQADEARERAVDAYMIAAESEAWRIASRAATMLAHSAGAMGTELEEGLTWIRHADVAAALGNAGEYDESGRIEARAAVLFGAGKLVEAAELYERAIEKRTAASSADHPEVARLTGALANLRYRLGDHAEARALHEQSLAIRESALSPDHPEVARGLNNLANVLTEAGELEGSRALHLRALEIRRKAFGDAHKEVAQTLGNLAAVESLLGEEERAVERLRLAIRILEHLGIRDATLARMLGNLAAFRGGRAEHLEEAEALARRGIQVFEEVVGRDHFNVAHSLDGLADILNRRGNHREAKRVAQRAHEIWANAVAEDHPNIAANLVHLGLAAEGLGERDEALGLLRRAVTLYDARDGLQRGEAKAWFALAKSLVHTDRDEGLAYARRAADDLRARGDAAAQSTADIEAWIEAQQ